MSTTVDSKVVEMRFDNQHFEKNVATTMSTLDKLKQKLHLDGATKGLENVETAAKKVDMSSLGGAVETVRTKFSALQVVGITALANITNSAVNAGKRIVESLTVAPVKDGWGEYEMTLNAVQTTMAGTGKTAKEVETELKKLDEYADKTVYSTADMLNNLPKFTNAGVELEKATEAMIGIANATALAGGDAGKASIAFYNLGQAIGTGYLTRMDYNSINNAGIATMEWKNQMVEAAIAAGTLKDAGDGMYIAGKKTLTLQQLFIDGLQEQWATTDVMMKVFGDYGNETTEIGQKAYAAAQDIKTFSMMMDSLKATAGTGWKDTWQTIFGGLDEAKVFWTGLSNFISNIITKMADIRNGILESALGKSFTQLSETITSVSKPMKAVGDTVKETVKSISDLGEIVDKVIGGKFGNGQERFDALTKAGQNFYAVQNKVNEKLGNSFRYTEEQIAAQDKLIGTQTELNDKQSESAKNLDKLSEAEAKQIADLAALSNAQLEELGYTEEQIEAFKELRSTAKKLGLPLEDLIANLDEINGRWLLINSFKNIGKGLVGTFEAMKKAWMDIFPKTSIQNIANGLFDLISAFHRLTSKINIIDKDTGKLTDTGEKLRRTFDGIFAVVDLLSTIFGGAFKIAFKIATGILSHFNISVLDITAGIGDAFVKVRNVVDKVIDTITIFLVENVGEWIKKFKETEFFKTVAGWFEDASDTISKALDDISGRIKDFNASPLVERLKTFKDFLSDIGDSLKNSKIFTSIIDGVCVAFGKLKEFFGKFKLPKFSIDNLTNFFQNFVKIGEKIGETGSTGFIGAITGFFGHLKDNVANWNWQVFKETALEKFVTFWLKTGDKIKKAFEIGKEIANSIKEFLFGTEEVNLPVIMDAVTKFLWIIVLIKTIKMLDTIVSPFDNITNALNNFAASLKWDAMASAFKSMALALGVLTVCILVLGSMEFDKVWKNAAVLAGLMVVMAGVVIAMGAFAAKGKGIDVAGAVAAMLMLVGSIAILVHTLKAIDQLKLENPGKTFLVLGGILIALTAGVRMISKAGSSSFRSVAAILTLMAALKLMLEVIEDYDAFDWSGKRTAINKMLQMLLALSVAIRIASGGVKANSSASGLALTLIAMVISLKILIGVIEDFAAMDDKTLLKGGGVVIALLGVMTLMSIALSRANKGSVLEKGQKSVNNFTGLAVALLAVVAAIWLLGKMDINTLMQGGIAVAGALILFAGLMFAIGKSCSGLKMGPIIAVLITFVVLLAEMTAIIKLLEDVPWQSSISSAGALGMLILAMAFALRSLTKYDVSSGNIYKWVGAMALLALIMGILAGALYLMKKIPWETAIASAGGLSLLLATMAFALWTLTKYEVASSNIYPWIGAMAVLGLVVVELAAILWGMSKLGTTDAISNAAALSILISVLAGVLTVLSFLKVNKGAYAAVGAIALLGVVVLELGYFLHLMDGWNLGSMLPTVGVLSAMLLVLTGVMAVCALLGTILQNPMVMLGLAVAVAALGLLGLVVWEIGAVLNSLNKNGLDSSAIGAVGVISAMLVTLTGVLAVCTLLGTVLQNPMVMLGLAVAVAALALLGLVVWEIGAIVNSLNKSGLNSSAIGTVNVLSAMLVAMTVVLAALTVIGLLSPAAVGGVAALALLGLVVWEIGAIVKALDENGLGKAMPTVTTLISIVTALTTLLIPLTLIGLLGPAAFVGIAALQSLGLLIAEMGVVMLAVGGLLELCPFLEDWLDNGLNLFIRLATGFGEIISGFGVGLTSKLPEIGENLSSFADNLDTFLTTMGSVDDGVVDNAAKLADAILSLTKSNLLGSWTRGSIGELGTELSTFAGNAGDFISAMDGMKPETATSMESFANAVKSLNDVCGNNNFGDGALSTFGESIASFADNMKDVAASLADLTDDDVANIQRAATAANALVDLNHSLPRQGGWLQDIIGSKELAVFGRSIEAFADCLISYSNKVSGEAIDAEAIKISAQAGTALADLNGAIPAQGGWAQEIMGTKELTTFGRSIVMFAQCLVDYSAIVTGQPIDSEAIKASADAAGALAELNGKLPSQNGLWQAVAGEKDLGDFGTKLTSFANGVVAYANAASQIDETKIAAITNSGKAIDELVLVMDKVPDSGGWGEAIFGSNDGQSFGAALSALANGVSSYCETAATLGEDDITVIQNSKAVITELGTLMSNVPETADVEKMTALYTSIELLNGVASILNTITTSEYDYSGLGSLKNQIRSLVALINSIDAFTMSDEYYSLHSAVSQAADCADEMSKLNNYTYIGVEDFKSALTSLSGADVDGVIEAFSGKAADMTSAMESLIDAMTNGIDNNSDNVTKSMSSLIDKTVKAAKDKSDDFKTVGNNFATHLKNGIEEKDTAVESAAKKVGTKAASGARTKYSGMYSAGKYLGEGLVNGIKEKWDDAYDAGYTLGQKAVQGEKDGQQSESPSKATIKAGKWLGEGLIIGINRMGSSVYNAGQSMGKEAIGSISNSISKISSLVESGIEAQPTIRPVLDLSDVRSGVGSIGNMLDMNSSIGVRANVGAISSMMNQRSQNGANADVVSAIDKLNKKMDNMGNITNIIDGVTYDDGSNVSNAVRTIVRAARIERRV